jgi:hypothetical protein
MLESPVVDNVAAHYANAALGDDHYFQASVHIAHQRLGAPHNWLEVNPKNTQRLSQITLVSYLNLSNIFSMSSENRQ